MANTFYPQIDQRCSTLTVGQLMESLHGLDPAAPVVFRCPRFGAFGPDAVFTIDKAEAVSMPREEIHYPAATREDDETGVLVEEEAWTYVKHAWSGVVLG